MRVACFVCLCVVMPYVFIKFRIACSLQSRITRYIATSTQSYCHGLKTSDVNRMGNGYYQGNGQISKAVWASQTEEMWE